MRLMGNCTLVVKAPESSVLTRRRSVSKFQTLEDWILTMYQKTVQVWLKFGGTINSCEMGNFGGWTSAMLLQGSIV